MAVAVFFDTSVLLAGLIDFGPQSAPSQGVMHELAEQRVRDAATGWHCCLEFYSVSTRLPPEYRLTPLDAVRLLETEVLGRMGVHDLPPGDRLPTLKAAAEEGTGGGRIYDAHIAEIARASGTPLIVTDNRRHFLGALRHGMRVDTPAEYLASLKRKRSN